MRERLHIVEARRLPPDYVKASGQPVPRDLHPRGRRVQVLPLVVIDTMAATLQLDSENGNSEASAAMAALKQGFNWAAGVAGGTR